jgi:hypothetical protein
MGFSVKERGSAVATFRYVQVKLMEVLSEWVPSTPEIEVKLLFGSHIWDAAQHADAFGKRTYELRLPLQHSLEPAQPYVRLLEDLNTTTDTTLRISGFYDAILPGLRARYEKYLEETDRLMDAPTVRILERVMDEEARMIKESRELREQLKNLQPRDDEWITRLSWQERAIENLVARVATPAPQSQAAQVQ